jgi:hypothetical protein
VCKVGVVAEPRRYTCHGHNSMFNSLARAVRVASTPPSPARVRVFDSLSSGAEFVSVMNLTAYFRVHRGNPTAMYSLLYSRTEPD